VRAHGAVGLPPATDEHLCFQEGVEDFAVQQLVSQLAVEALHVAVLPWRSRLDEECLHPDPQVIALCDAIAANDVARMKELIAAGADVNARGKGNMTPLLWAFVDNKPERFRLLLEAGANPNVYIESDFGIRQAFSPGDSVTHMACRRTFDHFWPVFEHGGDPNLPNKEPGCRGESPVYNVIKSGAGDKKKRIARLAEAGASLNRAPDAQASPLVTAESWFGRYDLCLLLLDLGADPRQYEGNEITKITHLLDGTLEDKARGEGQLRDASPQKLGDRRGQAPVPA